MSYKYLDANTILERIANSDGSETQKLYRNGTQAWANLMSTQPTVETAEPEPLPTYREVRARRYAAELSPEGDMFKSIGDCLDALITAQVDGDFTKLNSLKTKIDQIKAEIPKPS